MALVFLLPNFVIAADRDGDGIENQDDNCPKVPNGPLLGTCAAGDLKNTCTSNGDCGVDGFCSMNQEDSDFDSYGDACDFCIGDGHYDTDEDGLCDRDDNCYSVPNPDQNVSDGDGFGDMCTNNIPLYNPLVTLKGNYEEIGRQVAHRFPDTIFFAAVDVFMVLGVSPLLAQNYYDTIEDLIPQSIKDYMQGMAFGLTEVRPYSYQTAWDLVIVNTFAISILNMPDGCTAFAVTSNAGTFLAHNTDNSKGSEHNGAAMYFVPNNGDNSYTHLFTPAFVDVGLGLNDKGIGITYNVGNPNVNATTGLPPLFMVRYVMEKASTLDEAVSYFTDFIDAGNYYGHGGAIFLVVDFNDSSMAKIQVRSEKVKVTYGEELKPGVTYISSTNHFDEDFRDDPDYYYESSWLRLERLLEILPQFETYDLETCFAILSDHGDGEANNNTISRNGTSTGTTVTNVFTYDKVYYTLGRPHEYLDVYPGPVIINHCYNPDDTDSDGDDVVDCCDNCPDADPNPNQEDADCDGVGDICDSCPATYNPNQEDHYPQPEGNGLGDACECQGNFDCDSDCDGTDAAYFKADFGRSAFSNPCNNESQCNGDFDCDNDCDGTDAANFKTDFGRSSFNNPCPICTQGDWCSYGP
jgi:hypothetical protein